MTPFGFRKVLTSAAVCGSALRIPLSSMTSGFVSSSQPWSKYSAGVRGRARCRPRRVACPGHGATVLNCGSSGSSRARRSADRGERRHPPLLASRPPLGRPPRRGCRVRARRRLQTSLGEPPGRFCPAACQVVLAVPGQRGFTRLPDEGSTSPGPATKGLRRRSVPGRTRLVRGGSRPTCAARKPTARRRTSRRSMPSTVIRCACPSSVSTSPGTRSSSSAPSRAEGHGATGSAASATARRARGTVSTVGGTTRPSLDSERSGRTARASDPS